MAGAIERQTETSPQEQSPDPELGYWRTIFPDAARDGHGDIRHTPLRQNRRRIEEPDDPNPPLTHTVEHLDSGGERHMYTWGCGCSVTVDAYGNEYISACGSDHCERIPEILQSPPGNSRSSGL